MSLESNQQPLRILIIGDSLDQHMCFHLAKEHPTPMAHLPLRCYVSPKLIITYIRIHGIRGVNISELMSNITIKHSTDQDIVIFSSIAWDIKNSHDPWCTTRLEMLHTNNSHGSLPLVINDNCTELEVNCYCDYRKADGDPDCLKAYTGMQQFLSQRPPWCTLDVFHEWQIAFKETILALQSTFPEALLLFRNHPFAASLFMGSESCLGLFNQEIRRVSLLGCTQQKLNNDDEGESESQRVEVLIQPRLLDSHSLLLQGIHHLGTNQGLPSPQFNDHLHYESAAKY
jgi:hypothetical protein